MTPSSMQISAWKDWSSFTILPPLTRSLSLCRERNGKRGNKDVINQCNFLPTKTQFGLKYCQVKLYWATIYYWTMRAGQYLSNTLQLDFVLLFLPIGDEQGISYLLIHCLEETGHVCQSHVNKPHMVQLLTTLCVCLPSSPCGLVQQSGLISPVSNPYLHQHFLGLLVKRVHQIIPSFQGLSSTLPQWKMCSNSYQCQIILLGKFGRASLITKSAATRYS